MSKWTHVYVVYRVDSRDEGVERDPRLSVTIKEVLPSAEEAEAEVERLNADKPGRYFWQVAKHYPEGRGIAGTLPTTSTKS